ncbi:MAG: hypothetical protein JRD89_13230 [Deltaproteobacteria bacterium]|nr:hypothetical protein [Deltaproteobacteria bacterium]
MRDEQKLKREIKGELRGIPVWRWLKTIKGIDAVMAGGLVAWLDDPARAPHPSSWFRYAGLDVWPYCLACEEYFDFDWRPSERPKCPKCGAALVGRAPRRVRGEKAPWNWRLRTHLWKVFKQILQAEKRKGVYKEGAFYGPAYERYKAEEIEKCRREGLRIVPSEDLPTKGGKKYEPPGVISVGHVDARARRRMLKLFLAHLWVVWRTMEGLPVHEPYAARLGHRVIPPPNWPLKEGKKRG